MSLLENKKATSKTEETRKLEVVEAFKFETIVENDVIQEAKVDELVNNEEEGEEISDLKPKKVYADGYSEKKTKKEPTKKREGRVIEEISIFDGVDEAVPDEEDLDWIAWHELEDYQRKNQILESIVCGVEPNDKNFTVRIITKFGRFNRIVIPDERFFYNDSFKEDFYKETLEKQFKRKFQMARNCIGARISFIIKGMERKKKKDGGYINVIVASRRDAAIKNRNHYFFNPKGPRVTVGDIVEPRIISMNRIGCKVEACGVEVRMNMTQLSSSHWVKDCTKEFHIGQKFQARIKKLEADKGTGKVDMVLSCSDLKTSTLRDGIENAYPGKVALGEVIAYNKEKKIATCVLHGDILAAVHKKDMLNGAQLRPTDKVSVTIHTIDEKNGYVWGSAAKINTRD